MSASTEHRAGEPATHGETPGAAGQDGGPGTGRPAGNGLATASLVTGIAGITLVTVIPALVCGLLGLRRASRHGPAGRGPGAARCWAGIGLSVVWATAGLYLLPHLVRAADPGCTAYKGAALTAYNRVIGDLSSTSQTTLASVAAGSGGSKITRDMAHAVTALNRAAARSHSAATSRDISRLSRQLQTVLADIRAGSVVPDSALAALNRDSAAADTSCGTLNV